MRSRGPVPCGAAGAGAQVPRCPLCCLLPAASRSQDSNLGTGQQPPQVITRVAELLGCWAAFPPFPMQPMFGFYGLRKWSTVLTNYVVFSQAVRQVRERFHMSIRKRKITFLGRRISLTIPSTSTFNVILARACSPNIIHQSWMFTATYLRHQPCFGRASSP